MAMRRRETDAVLDRPAGPQGQAGPEVSSQASPGSNAGEAAGASRPAGSEPEPTIDQIAQRAFEIYQSRGGSDGQDMDDWLQAERELRRGSPE